MFIIFELLWLHQIGLVQFVVFSSDRWTFTSHSHSIQAWFKYDQTPSGNVLHSRRTQQSGISSFHISAAHHSGLCGLKLLHSSAAVVTLPKVCATSVSAQLRWWKIDYLLFVLFVFVRWLYRRVILKGIVIIAVSRRSSISSCKDITCTCLWQGVPWKSAERLRMMDGGSTSVAQQYFIGQSA